jgi:SagB-type dehydrogenase family enzyme
LRRLVRHPDLLLWWNDDGPVVRNLESGVTLSADRLAADVLASFDLAREPSADDPAKVRGKIRFLRRLGFLIPESEARKKRSRIASWKENVASALHQSASKDLRYIPPGRAAEDFVRERLPPRRPALVKRYRDAPRVPLPAPAPVGADLDTVLVSRRTVREFGRRPVSLADVSAVVGGTFGRTGSHDAGIFGRLMIKTSPSAGSLHPIECYVLAWNVEGLAPGIYHYDVGAGDLRRLRRGRFRAQAVRAASGQTWVGRSAFLCVMTAVVGRSLWKYQDEVTYRTLFLDAGHLAQTFCLLATSRGLGPFTTAAIQDSYIEKLLGLDGAREFPVYLCGAGHAAKRRSEP